MSDGTLGWMCHHCGQGGGPNETAVEVAYRNHQVVCVGQLQAPTPMNVDPFSGPVFTGLLPARRSGKSALAPSVAPGNALLRPLKQGLNSGTALKHYQAQFMPVLHAEGV